MVPAEGPPLNCNDCNIDWDGLKRVYDEIENRGGKLELTLIESVKKLRTQRTTVTPKILHVSIVMVSFFVGPIFRLTQNFCIAPLLGY